MVVVSDDGHIKEQLDIVAFGVAWDSEVTLWVIALSRFLLDEDSEVVLDIVHTSLKTKHLAEERGFHNTFVDFEVAHALRKCFPHGSCDVLSLHFRIVMEGIAEVSGEQTDGIALEELFDAFLVCGWVVVCAVDLFVEHLAGEVTE